MLVCCVLVFLLVSLCFAVPQAKRADLDALKTEFFLWQLFHVGRLAAGRRAAQRALDGELASAKEDEAVIEARNTHKRVACTDPLHCTLCGEANV